MNYVPIAELHWIAPGWGWCWLCSSLSFTGTFLSDWVIIRDTEFVYGHKNTLIKLHVAGTEIFQMRCLCEQQQRPQYSHWHVDQYILNKASFHFFVWTQGTIFYILHCSFLIFGCTSSHTTHSNLSTWLLLDWTAWLSRDTVCHCHCLNQTCIGFILEHCCAFK